MKCNLPADINQCPYFLTEKQECKKESACSFQQKAVSKPRNQYIREERWYEKYYKKK